MIKNNNLIGQRFGRLTVDRIDNNNGNYEPNNCRWATMEEQNRNKRNNIMVDGLCLKDYCRENNLNYETIRQRLKRGWTIKKALNEPVKAFRPIP